MKPVVVLVGRPNVGKSTLFNRLTRTRDAIVVDVPGVTRDRHYGEGKLGERPFLVVDTGGLEPTTGSGIFVEMKRQADQAIAEADAVVFVLDARAGLTPDDRRIATDLRKRHARVWLAANKAEGIQSDVASAEFHELGMGEPIAISAAHGEGVRHLLETVLEGFPEDEPVDESEFDPAGKPPRVAIVGRPNVGKSTLVNALVGEERVIAFDAPGTTRDPIDVPFHYRSRDYVLVDTAGLRKRGRSQGEEIEQYSIIKTLQAVEGCNVVVFVIDANDGISDQDAHVAGYILERGRAVVVAVNKWDAADNEAREKLKGELAWKIGFMGFAKTLYISARDKKGLPDLMTAVDKAYAAAMAKLSTPKLTRTLIAAVERQQPPRRGAGRPKLRYAHQGGQNPPRIIIHGNQLNHVPDTYKRYLEGVFRKAFDLEGTPLRVELRTGTNPYASRARGTR
jgi:GTP-binding protein